MTGREPAFSICGWTELDTFPLPDNEWFFYSRQTSTGEDGSLLVHVVNTAAGGEWDVETKDGVFTSMVANTVLTPGSWHHLCAVQSGGTISFYLNGNPDGSDSYAQPANVASLRQTIGAAWNGGAGLGPPDGVVDDVRIYNRALSPTEIQQLYKLGTVRITQ